MAVGIHTIRTLVTAALEAALPDVRPDLRYKEARADAPLEEMARPMARPTAVRAFHVVPSPQHSLFVMQKAAGAYLRQELHIHLRYPMPALRNSHDDLMDMVASDAARVTVTLLEIEYQPAGGPNVSEILPRTGLLRRPQDDLYVLELVYDIVYGLSLT